MQFDRWHIGEHLCAIILNLGHAVIKETTSSPASIPSLVANLFSQTSPFVQFDSWHIGEHLCAIIFNLGHAVIKETTSSPASITSLVANLFSQTSPYWGTFMCNYFQFGLCSH